MRRGLQALSACALALAVVAALMQPAVAQDGRTAVIRYHPMFERALRWGMSATETAQNFTLTDRQALADGGSIARLHSPLPGAGPAPGGVVPLAPGVPATPNGANAAIPYWLVYGPAGGLRRIDLGAPDQTARPFFSYGEPIVLWRWEADTLDRAFTEYVWIMGSHQIARAIQYAEEPGQGGYRRERIVWAALEHLPPGAVARPAIEDPAPPTRPVLGVRPMVEMDRGGEVTVANGLTMPAPVSAVPAQPAGPEPPPGEAPTLADLQAIFDNLAAPSPADCAALSAWFAERVDPEMRRRFDNLFNAWVRRLGGGDAAAIAQRSAGEIDALIARDIAFARAAGRAANPALLNALNAAAPLCRRT